MAVMLPILTDVGVTPTSLAVLGPPGPPPVAVLPPVLLVPVLVPVLAPVVPPLVPSDPAVPSVPAPVVAPLSPASACSPAFVPDCDLTKALLGSRVPHAGRIRARTSMTRGSLDLRRTVSSRARRRRPTIP